MLILESLYSYQEEIKKSRFLARAKPVDQVEDALQFIEESQDLQANHNCWAYKINNLYRFSDDGEPGGTAGKPILNAINSQRMDQVVVLVTRYFGGIKLGTGGLIRAYGGVAATCLRKAPKRPLILKKEIVVSVDFSFTGQVHALLKQFDSEKLDEVYTDEGLMLRLAISETDVSAFSQKLTNVCQGKATIEFPGN